MAIRRLSTAKCRWRWMCGSTPAPSMTGGFQEVIHAPAPAGGGGGASASSVEVETVKPFKVCQADHCSIWHVELKNPSYFYKKNSNDRWTSYWEPGTQVHCNAYYPFYYAPELEARTEGCDFIPTGEVWQGEHRHLTIWGRYTIIATGVTIFGDVITETRHLALLVWVWPNGEQQRVERDWDPAIPESEA